MATVGEKMTAIANAIRTKTGKTDKLTLDTMASDLNAIVERTSSDLTASGATITVPAGNYKSQATKSISTVTRASTTISVTVDDSNDKLTITASNNQGTGYVTGANKTATKTISLTASGSSVTASDGTNSISKSVSTTTQATPSISVSSAGLITASATQTAGYVAAGTKSATKQLTVQAAQTITPGTSNKTIASDRYLTGTQTIKGDANLVASNIKTGVDIFGVAGNYGGIELNFEVVGGTTQPTNPIENTIWVNTSTEITGWTFSSTAPETSIDGFVWISISDSSNIAFNVLKENGVYVYPIFAQQYINNTWTYVEANSYHNGQWESWWDGDLYFTGEINPVYTNSLYVENNTTYTENDTSITIKSTYSGSTHIKLQNIDVTEFSKLYLNVIGISREYANNEANACAYFGLINSETNESTVGATIINGSGGGSGLKSIDISSITGKQDLYIKLYVYRATSSCYIQITFDKWYLER